MYEFKRYICVWNSKTLRYLSRKQVQTISRLKGLLDGGGDAGLLTSRGVVAIVVVAVSVVVGSSETGGSRNLAVGTYTGRALAATGDQNWISYGVRKWESSINTY